MWTEMFEGAKVVSAKIDRLPRESMKKYADRSYNELCNRLERLGNGSRGYVGMGFRHAGNGHAIFFKVDNGVVKFYDAQSPKEDTNNLFAVARPDEYVYCRLDNLKLKENVTSAVISVKEKNK